MYSVRGKYLILGWAGNGVETELWVRMGKTFNQFLSFSLTVKKLFLYKLHMFLRESEFSFTNAFMPSVLSSPGEPESWMTFHSCCAFTTRKRWASWENSTTSKIGITARSRSYSQLCLQHGLANLLRFSGNLALILHNFMPFPFSSKEPHALPHTHHPLSATSHAAERKPKTSVKEHLTSLPPYP